MTASVTGMRFGLLPTRASKPPPCVQRPGWVDALDQDCALYEENKWCRPDGYRRSWIPGTGTIDPVTGEYVTGVEACCTCGGGVQQRWYWSGMRWLLVDPTQVNASALVDVDGYLFNGEVSGPGVPLYGKQSIIGRSLVIYKNSSSPTDPPWLCSTLLPALAAVAIGAGLCNDGWVGGGPWCWCKLPRGFINS